MAFSFFDHKGTSLDAQRFTWRDLVQPPISKLDDDAFTRVMVILMNGIESDSLRFSHICSRMNKDLRLPLAEIRRVEQHQETVVNWLIGPDHSALETTIGYEQVAIEVTAALAQTEPDPYIAQVLRFGLLEDFDHLYRYSALLDRVEGKDANTITQCYTDILPGRPTREEHRAPRDNIRHHYNRSTADPITKLHSVTIVAGEYQTHDYYMNIGPQFSDPIARQLYAEIASIEEQHVTQYECMLDPAEGWLEKWLLHEATEAYNYYSCVQQESNPRIKSIWERFLDYELGHVHYVMDLFKRYEKRAPAEVLPASMPDPLPYYSEKNRNFVRETLRNELDLRADGPEFVEKAKESTASLEYRRQMNSQGSPTEEVAASYKWSPGTELVQDSAAV